MSVHKLWAARGLAVDARKDKFRATMSQHAESVLLHRSWLIVGWIMIALGAAMMGGSIYGWVRFLPLKQTIVKFALIDRSIGVVSEPVGAKDAPTLFPEATQQYYLKQYVLNCYGWVPPMRHHMDRVCRLMSSPQQQERYEEWQSTAGPRSTIGNKGLVGIGEYLRYHKEAEVTDRGVTTYSYQVQFFRTVWHGAAAMPTESWTAVIDFQFHPEALMAEQDRDDNLVGMQVLSATPTADAPH